MLKTPKLNLLENFLSLGALQIVSYVIPLISLLYLSRVLGVEKFGLVFFAFAFMAYFIILTDYGFGLSATREIAVNRHNKNNLSNIFSAVTCLKIIMLVASYIILLFVSVFVPKISENWLVFQLSFLMVIGNAIYPVWFFQGMERMKYITFLNILSKLIFLILIFFFVKHESDYIIVPLLNSLGFLVAGMIGMYFAIKHLGAKLYIPSWQAIKKQFKYSSDFFLSRVSVSLVTNTNSFCLGMVGSNIMVGYYVAAEKIYNAMQGVCNPVNQALYPFIAKNRDIKLYKKIFYISTIINIFICAFIFIFAKNIVTIFYGQEMLPAYRILRVFSIAMLLDFPTILIGYPFIAALGYTKEANRSVMFTAIFHLIGLFVLYLTKHLNIYCISYLVAFSVFITFSFRFGTVIKYKLWNTNYKENI